MKRQVHVYKDNEVSTASKLRLVIIMYDGVIHYLEECKKKHKEGDIAGRGLYISKAQRVVAGLQESLNTREGGEVAQNLESLYSFILDTLIKTNIKSDISGIDRAIEVLTNLRYAWVDVMAAAPKGNGDDGNGSKRLTIHS